ncbi:MAG: glutathione S-transferase family protein [Deltaproteobacteria bacterium]|nr:glutathione S-transferase family protein [Deltaproteobacteria bacterium]
MAITLYHHPFSRAAGVLWTLEELGEPYELVYVDIRANAQKQGDVVARNPMGKVPLLVDGDATITEAAAIALYLADRYAPGRLAPRLDDPRRGTYFRWSLFAPSVIEPGAMAKLNNWEFRPGQAGWGDYESMLRAIDSALTPGPFLLGEQFTIADVIFGGTLRYMTMFKMLDASPAVAGYLERLNARPALQRADARNQEIAKAHGLV